MTVVGPFGLSVRDQALEADVQTGLSAVEAGLLDATKSEVPFITEAAQHRCGLTANDSGRCW